MKIIQLTAENVKRLKVVDITPKGHLTQITGRNHQGKTSVLDSIWWALGGERAIQGKPIREGAKAARIRLNLEEFIVERKFLPSGSSTITVRLAQGSERGVPDRMLPRAPGSPQEILNSLVGRLSFDPLAFANMNAKQQYDELKSIVKLDVDIEALEAANVLDYKERTGVNTLAKEKRAQASGLVVPDNLPVEEIDTSEILTKMQRAASFNSAIESEKARRENLQRDANEKKREGVRLREESASQRENAQRRIAELERQLQEYRESSEKLASDTDARATDALNAAGKIEREIDSLPAMEHPIDLSSLRSEFDAAVVINEGISKRRRRDEIIREAEELEIRAAKLTDRMESRDNEKREAIARAKMPVDGLSFGGGEILFNGIPFEQASDSERLRVSVAIAMAANPKLRVIRIRNGSLLDEEGIQMISDLAKENDYQIWMERVDSSGKIGIVMEDGEVASDNRTEVSNG